MSTQNYEKDMQDRDRELRRLRHNLEQQEQKNQQLEAQLNMIMERMQLYEHDIKQQSQHPSTNPLEDTNKTQQTKIEQLQKKNHKVYQGIKKA